ncbi:uncharacterized protein LOC34622704 [Cyclospora cayetanensis]|uniref:Uncharacterized protein LOC34622704 n=1 Tax=Cyclospora cayetanensis TaxID=88456 RepID=A0A6P6S0Q4_9EIME|nr:uncharacterized protein LOC34622704 [Cyclospora cayetanensis]
MSLLTVFNGLECAGIKKATAEPHLSAAASMAAAVAANVASAAARLATAASAIAETINLAPSASGSTPAIFESSKDQPPPTPEFVTANALIAAVYNAADHQKERIPPAGALEYHMLLPVILEHLERLVRQERTVEGEEPIVEEDNTQPGEKSDAQGALVDNGRERAGTRESQLPRSQDREEYSVYVRGISRTSNSAALARLFSCFGHVTSFQRKHGYCFATYSSLPSSVFDATPGYPCAAAAAATAIHYLDGAASGCREEKRLSVTLAKISPSLPKHLLDGDRIASTQPASPAAFASPTRHPSSPAATQAAAVDFPLFFRHISQFLSLLHGQQKNLPLMRIASRGGGFIAAKELSESMGVAAALQFAFKKCLRLPLESLSALVFVPGDGQHPRTSAAVCLQTPASWRCVSIDPRMQPQHCDPTIQHTPSAHASAAASAHTVTKCRFVGSLENRVFCFRGTAEAFCFQDLSTVMQPHDGRLEGPDTIVLLGVHSHAPLQEFFDKLLQVYGGTAKHFVAISLPCCGSSGFLRGPPISRYRDPGILSHENEVYIHHIPAPGAMEAATSTSAAAVSATAESVGPASAPGGAAMTGIGALARVSKFQEYPCTPGSVPLEAYVLLLLLLTGFGFVAATALLQWHSTKTPAAAVPLAAAASRPRSGLLGGGALRSKLLLLLSFAAFLRAVLLLVMLLLLVMPLLPPNQEYPPQQLEPQQQLPTPNTPSAAQGQQQTSEEDLLIGKRDENPAEIGGAPLATTPPEVTDSAAHLRVLAAAPRISESVHASVKTRGASMAFTTSAPDGTFAAAGIRLPYASPAEAALPEGARRGLWPSPLQCAPLDIWWRTLFQFTPSLLFVSVFLLLGAFSWQLYAAATLQRSSSKLGPAAALVAAAAGMTAFLLAAAFSYGQASQHLFQRLACVIVGGLYVLTASLLLLFGTLVLRELRKRDALMLQPLLHLQQHHLQHLQHQELVAPETFAESAMAEGDYLLLPNCGLQQEQQQHRGSRSGSSSSNLTLQLSLGAAPAASRRHASDSNNIDELGEEARMRLFLIACCCPPLLLLLGVYMLLVGLWGRHMYPTVVQQHQEHLTFDLILLFGSELLPSLLVLKAFMPWSKNSNSTSTTHGSISKSTFQAYPSPYKEPSSVWCTVAGASSDGARAFQQLQLQQQPPHMGALQILQQQLQQQESASDSSCLSSTCENQPSCMGDSPNLSNCGRYTGSISRYSGKDVSGLLTDGRATRRNPFA